VLHQRACSNEGACPFHETVIAAVTAYREQLRGDSLAAVAGRVRPAA
jgi:hypothetical protein